MVTSILNSKAPNEHENSPHVERIIEVYPSDYVTLKNQVLDDSKKISDLQRRCRSLEHMLAFCDISPMDHIIHDYKSMSDFYIAQLTIVAAVLADASPEEYKFLYNKYRLNHSFTLQNYSAENP